MSNYLEFNHISKNFPGVRALDDVCFSIKAGSVHGLVGENGAGKSTLLKILSGAHIPSSGNMVIDDRQVEFSMPKDAFDAGIAVIYQELNLVPDMSVAENLMLGHIPAKYGFVKKEQLFETARKELGFLMEDIHPGMKVKRLPIAQRQMIEIGKALLQNARIIAFDEPTSSLSKTEILQLFRIIRELRDKGCAIIYVSHRLNEIFEVCDAVTVFRDGKKIETFTDMKEVNHDLLVNRMVGRAIDDIYGYRPRKHGEVLFEVSDFICRGISKPASFSIKKGEVVGFFGLVGAGRSELMRGLYGVSRSTSGSVSVAGKKVTIRSPGEALSEGVVFCPEDRKQEGIIPVRNVSENINISVRRQFVRGGIFLNSQRERANATEFIDKLQIKTPSMEQLVGNLSGGNQQKVVLARMLSIDNKVIIMDEPTRGIDVGTKSQIYRLIYSLAETGKAIVVISSELPEVMGVSDRIIIMREGGIVAEVTRQDATEEKILQFALPVQNREEYSTLLSGEPQ